MKSLVRNALNMSAIPADLASVTRYADEIDPTRVGMTPRNVDAIWQATEALYRTGVHPGMQLCIRRKGEIVLHRSLGHAHGNGPNDPASAPKVLMGTDTPVCYFSASKAVTALLMHILAERGEIDLMDPVSFYCPEFAANGKRNITIHHILAHRGGIPGIPPETPLDTLWNRDEIWRLLCEAKPITADGDKLAYHAITGGYVVERVLEKVTGQSIETFLDENLRKPMGMKWFTYGIAPEHLAELACNYATGPTPVFPLSWAIKRALGGDMQTIEQVTNDPRFQEAVIPAGNLVGTAEEMSRFFQMMLNGGEWNGHRICQPMTIRRLVQEYGTLALDRTMLMPMRYSAGMMLGGEPFGIWGPNSGQAFGHIGLINKLCWADAARDISVTLLTSGIAIVAHHLPALANFVVAVTRHCPPVPVQAGQFNPTAA